MSTMTPAELLTLWKQEEIAVEMTTGHLLQNLVKQQTTIESLTLLVGKLRTDMDKLLMLASTQDEIGHKSATVHCVTASRVMIGLFAPRRTSDGTD